MRLFVKCAKITKPGIGDLECSNILKQKELAFVIVTKTIQIQNEIKKISERSKKAALHLSDAGASVDKQVIIRYYLADERTIFECDA